MYHKWELFKDGIVKKMLNSLENTEGVQEALRA